MRLMVAGMVFGYMILISILAGLEEWVGVLVTTGLLTLCCCTLAIAEAIKERK